MGDVNIKQENISAIPNSQKISAKMTSSEGLFIIIIILRLWLQNIFH